MLAMFERWLTFGFGGGITTHIMAPVITQIPPRYKFLKFFLELFGLIFLFLTLLNGDVLLLFCSIVLLEDESKCVHCKRVLPFKGNMQPI